MNTAALGGACGGVEVAKHGVMPWGGRGGREEKFGGCGGVIRAVVSLGAWAPRAACRRWRVSHTRRHVRRCEQF